MSGFDGARLGALVHDLLAVVRRRPADLLPFEEVRERLKLRRVVDRGTSDVPLAKIVGTYGRRGEFNRVFLPRSESLRERWEDLKDLAEGAAGFRPARRSEAATAPNARAAAASNGSGSKSASACCRCACRAARSVSDRATSGPTESSASVIAVISATSDRCASTLGTATRIHPISSMLKCPTVEP